MQAKSLTVWETWEICRPVISMPLWQMSAFGRAAGGTASLPCWNPDETSLELLVMKSGHRTNLLPEMTFNLHTCRSFGMQWLKIAHAHTHTFVRLYLAHFPARCYTNSPKHTVHILTAMDSPLFEKGILTEDINLLLIPEQRKRVYILHLAVMADVVFVFIFDS